MKLQTGLSLVLVLTLLGISTVPAEAAITPATSPLAPINRNAKSTSDKQLVVLNKKETAHLARAAICTEDIAQIKFQEYYVDWSGWMSEVGDRWSTVFNATARGGKFRTDGPTLIQFTCKSDGTISEIGLARSSGDIVCDENQIRSLVNCMPLPAFPIGSRKQTITMLYVWEYGQARQIAKPVRPLQKAKRPSPDRITISGKLM